MVTTHRHNPILKNKLLAQLTNGSAEGLSALLRSLSVSEFRTAGYLLSNELLCQLDSNRYWEYFLHIVPANSKAFLVTFLKAAVQLYRKQKLALDVDVLETFAAKASAIDIHKTLQLLIPEMCTHQDLSLLLQVCGLSQLEKAAPYLLHAGTPLAYYQMFCLLKTAEAEPDVLVHYVHLLIRRSDQLSFNMASIVRHYFDLPNIHARFSLQLADYELSRLDQGPEYFLKILTR